MSKRESSSVSAELVLSLVALAVGMMALYFAWDANRISREANDIARRQSTSLVAPISVEYLSGTFAARENGKRFVGCAYDVRLVNLGGASADIVEHEATVYLSGHEQSIRSTGSIAYAKQPFSTTMENIEVILLKDPIIGGIVQGDITGGEWISDTNRVDLPMRIDAFSTLEVFPRLSLIIDSAVSTVSAMENEPSHILYNPRLVEGHSPFEVVFAFTLASGQVVRTPKTVCFYAK